ncbi:MAG TPA: RiPP maturation radical SAM C-methyltransferase [bacterium]|nr:RiPP maturation radical SAM C-methyltransferase [bacterium]
MGMLAAGLRRAGISTAVCYANVLFAEALGVDDYQLLAGGPLLAGEWTFAGAAFPEMPECPDEFAESLRRHAAWRGETPAAVAAWLRRARARAQCFTTALATQVIAARPRIVAVSAVCQQQLAALALVRAVREQDAGIITVIGGAQVEGGVGRALLRQAPWLDYVVSGEADEIFPPFCRDLLAHGRNPAARELPAGVSTRHHAACRRAQVAQLAALPCPDYDDYFTALRMSSLADRVRPGILLETSRGCRHAVRQPCTFCAQHGLATGYREKSTDQLAAEIRMLTDRHDSRFFFAADNITADATLLVALAREADADRCWSVTVRAAIPPRHLEQLAAQGVQFLQAGIESLSARTLRALQKGTTVCDNLRLLRTCRSLGMRVRWLYLVRVPGDTDDDYAAAAALIPQLHHFEPPLRVAPLRYDRFSQYYEQREHGPWQLVTPLEYAHLYPAGEHDRAELALYFTVAGEDPEPQPGLHALLAAVAGWQQAWQRLHPLVPVVEIPRLAWRDDGGAVQISDTRGAMPRSCRLAGLTAAIFRIAQAAPLCREALADQVVQQHPGTSPADLSAAIEELIAAGLLYAADNQLFGLANADPCRQPVPMSDFPGGIILPAGRTMPAHR